METKDCVNAIVNAYPNMGNKWKRRAKYQVVHDSDWCTPVWMREFTTADAPDHTAFVWSDDSKIIDVRVLTPRNDIKNLFVREVTNYGVHIYFTEQSDESVDRIAPLVKCEDDYEPLDFENYEVIGLTNNTVTLNHGGDWQEPMMVTYRYMSDGNLYHIHSSIACADFGSTKFDDSEVLEKE
jgi:hypothetical protein